MGQVRAGPAFYHQIGSLARKEKGTRHHSRDLEELLLIFQTSLYLEDVNADKVQKPQMPW